MSDEDIKKYRFKKKKIYAVQCPFDEKHVFDKMFELEEGVDGEPTGSEVDAFCPFCDKMVTVPVIGEAAKNEVLLRRFEEQEKRLKAREEEQQRNREKMRAALSD